MWSMFGLSAGTQRKPTRRVKLPVTLLRSRTLPVVANPFCGPETDEKSKLTATSVVCYYSLSPKEQPRGPTNTVSVDRQ